MKVVTYHLIIDEIHQVNGVSKETLRKMPVSSIIDIFHNLFGSNGIYPQNYYVNE